MKDVMVESRLERPTRIPGVLSLPLLRAENVLGTPSLHTLSAAVCHEAPPPLPGILSGRSFLTVYQCAGCHKQFIGEPPVKFLGRPICSAGCFDRVAKADRLVTENVDPLPVWFILLSVVFIVLVAWGMTL